jgi:hypothetical protein
MPPLGMFKRMLFLCYVVGRIRLISIETDSGTFKKDFKYTIR